MNQEELKNLQAYINKCFNILSKHKDNLDTKRAEELFCYLGSLVAGELDNVNKAETLIEENLSLPIEKKLLYKQNLNYMRETLRNYQTFSEGYSSLDEKYPYAFSSKKDLKNYYSRYSKNVKKDAAQFFWFIFAFLQIVTNAFVSDKDIPPLIPMLITFFGILGTLDISGLCTVKKMIKVERQDNIVENNQQQRQMMLQKAKHTKLRN